MKNVGPLFQTFQIQELFFVFVSNQEGEMLQSQQLILLRMALANTSTKSKRNTSFCQFLKRSKRKEAYVYAPLKFFCPKTKPIFEASVRLPTSDMYEFIKESDWCHREEGGEIFEADLERIPVVQLEMGVHLEPKIRLKVGAQGIQNLETRVRKFGITFSAGCFFCNSNIVPFA